MAQVLTQEHLVWQVPFQISKVMESSVWGTYWRTTVALLYLEPPTAGGDGSRNMSLLDPQSPGVS